MHAIDILRNRQAAITSMLATTAATLDGLDLVEPVVPGTSPLALTLWHVPRARDWLVNTCLRGVGEVADRFEGLPDPDRYGFGTGLSPAEARVAAATVSIPRLLDYSAAVGAEIDTWLAGLGDADLDAVPPFLARQAARAAYRTPQAIAEVRHLDGLTVGMLVLRPAITHVVLHLGEIDTLVTVARARS